MAKGYWIARIDVHNMDGYKEYVAQNGAVFKKYGAKFLVKDEGVGAGLILRRFEWVQIERFLAACKAISRDA